MKNYKSLLAVVLTVAVQGSVAQGLSTLSPNSRILLERHSSMAVAGKSLAPSTDEPLSAYLLVDDALFDAGALEALGVKAGTRTGDILTVRLPLSSLDAVSRLRGVRYVQTGNSVQQQMDVARTETGADFVFSGEDLVQAYRGKGVVVGIVDAGFDYTHKAFYDADGKCRISRVWEQATSPQSGYVSPEGYDYGIEFTTQKSLEWALGDISGNSHGTHVAGIAAGSAAVGEGAYHGVAPESEIVLVSYKNDVTVSDAVAYIFRYAEQVGKPCVINLSLAMQVGPHDGTSLFDQVTDQLQGSGRLLVGATGNNRKGLFHLSRQFQSADTDTLRTVVNFPYALNSSYPVGELEIWAEAGLEFEVRVMSYNTFSKTADDIQTVYPSAEATQTLTFGNHITGSLLAATEVSPFNGKTHITLANSLGNARSNNVLALEIVPKGTGQLDVWADYVNLTLTDKNLAGFTQPDGESTVGEIGGTGKRILSVGAYTTRKEYSFYGSDKVLTVDEEEGDIWSYSSMGPTADGRMKPEVSAPGCLIISSLNDNDQSGTQIVHAVYPGTARSYSYGYMQGTSMAAPFVTGAVATWLEAFPQLTPEQLHEVVAATSRLDSHTGDAASADSLGFGYGKIDVWAGAKACQRLASSVKGVSSPVGSGFLLSEGRNLRLAFPAGVSFAHVRVFAPDGRQTASSSLRDISAGTELSLRDLVRVPGLYVFQVATPQGTQRIKAVIE